MAHKSRVRQLEVSTNQRTFTHQTYDFQLVTFNFQLSLHFHNRYTHRLSIKLISRHMSTLWFTSDEIDT